MPSPEDVKRGWPPVVASVLMRESRLDVCKARDEWER